MNTFLNIQEEFKYQPVEKARQIDRMMKKSLTQRIYGRGCTEKMRVVMQGLPQYANRRRRGEKYRPVQYND